MFEERLEKIYRSIVNRQKTKSVFICHTPTVEEPYLTYQGDGLFGYHNFGDALSVPEVDNVGFDNVSVSAEKVKELRDKYGYGILDCRNALQKANGDMKVAYDILRGLK